MTMDIYKQLFLKLAPNSSFSSAYVTTQEKFNKAATDLPLNPNR